jgi:anti-anti-sigma factor
MMTQTLSVISQNIEEQGVVMVTVQGSLDNQTYTSLESKIDRLIHHGDARIIIDLAGVDYVSSAGIRVFVTAGLKARHEHGGVVLMSLSEPVSRVVEMLQIREVLPIAKDFTEAVKLLAS